MKNRDLWMFGILFLCFLILGATYLQQNWHEMKDSSVVVASNLYSGNCSEGICGSITIHNLRNGMNYTVAPGCTYYTIGKSLTLDLQWSNNVPFASGPYSELTASVYIINPAIGCSSGRGL